VVIGGYNPNRNATQAADLKRWLMSWARHQTKAMERLTLNHRKAASVC
jgi:hypothetical protein